MSKPHTAQLSAHLAASDTTGRNPASSESEQIGDPTPKRDIWRVETIAERIEVHPEFIYGEIRAGRLPHLKIGKRLVRVTETQFQAWLSTFAQGGN